MTITISQWSGHGGDYDIEGDSIEDAITKHWDRIIQHDKPGGGAGYHLDAVYVEVNNSEWVDPKYGTTLVSVERPDGATRRRAKLIIESHGLPLAHEGDKMRPAKTIKIGIAVPVETLPGKHDIEVRRQPVTV